MKGTSLLRRERERTGKSSRKKETYHAFSLLGFLKGSVTLSGKASDAPGLLNLCMKFGIVYRDFAFFGPCVCPGEAEEGSEPSEQSGERMRLTVSFLTARQLIPLASAHGICLLVEHRDGLPVLIRALFRRPGLIVGTLLAAALLILGNSVLWEIRVTGNDTLSRTEVLRELESVGLCVGCRKNALDVDAMENTLLLRSEKISWITVNLIGTVAEVQIREKLTPEPSDPSGNAPANLVARCDGTIVSCEPLQGEVVVKTGDAVRAGELLVSGLSDSNLWGYRYTRARGKIYAETRHTFDVEIPFSYTKTVYTEEKTEAVSILFFGKELLLPGFGRGFSGGATESLSDGVKDGYESVSYLRIFGKNLPIGLSRRVVLQGEERSAARDAESAMELAYYRLSEEIAAIPDMRGLLEKQITTEITDTCYRLHCEIRCIENIAETKEIELDFLP